MSGLKASDLGAETLAQWVAEARQRTNDLVADLDDWQMMGARSDIVNPSIWEIGHVAWFQEKWVLRHLRGRPPLRGDADALYDSIAIPHETRWDLPFPTLEETLIYFGKVHDGVLDVLAAGEVDDALRYFVLLSLFHEDMHAEAFTYTRQTHGYPPPQWSTTPAGQAEGGRREKTPSAAQSQAGDVEMPGGRFLLGSTREEPFVLDNEQWAHAVEMRPFRISRTAVTQEQFAEFLEQRGYERDELWSEQGLDWKAESGATQPTYWRREQSGKWFRRDFDQQVSLEPTRPMLHVNWYEAEAFCRWAGRRLPTESEWEAAAAVSRGDDMLGDDMLGDDTLGDEKRRYPWGEAPPTADRANLDWQCMGAIDVQALPEGDSARGCRQMIGNVWEWTASDFLPYPGFEPGPYKEYSAPWFGDHKVLRGGCWCTRSRLIRSAYRNFYLPHRRDVWAGFRTCALET